MATPIRIKRSAVSGKRPVLDQLKLGELALNTYDGYLFTERDTGGVGIGTTITLLTPWSENFGAGSIYYQDNVGIGTDNTYGIKLSVDGSLKVTGVSTLGVTTATNLTVQQLNVSGVSTFGTGTIIIDGDNNNIQIGTGVTITSNSISLDGGLTVASFEVSGTSGLSTFASDLDIDASIDVDGHAELDTVNVSAASTFGGLVDINAGARANTFKVEDLTDNRVVIAGTGGELEDDANLTFDGSTLSVDVDLDVDGRTELDITNISETLNVVGIATFGSDLDINASVDIDGHTELDNLNVSGVSTFVSNVNLSANLDVDGQTDLDILNVAETATFSSNIDANGNLDVDGQTDLDVLNVAELATFTGNIDANGNLDVDGQTDLDVLNVAELATFTNNINANGNIVGDDATNISGINSVTASSFFGSGIGLTSLNADDLSSGTIPDARFPSILPALDGSALTGITATAVGAIGGLTVKDEGTTVGTAGSISSFNFVGSNVSVIANEGAAGVATVTIDTITNNSTVLIDGSSAISIDNVGGGSTSFRLNQSNDKVVNIGIVTSQVTGIVTSQLNLGAPLNNFLQTPSSSNFASVVSDNTGTGSLVFAESPSLKDVSIKDGVGDVYSIGGFSASYSTTSQVDIHSILLASTYRSVEYTIQATEGTNYHTTKIIALHDGTTVSKSEYGTIHNNDIVAVFDIDITSGEIRLLATAESANETTYKISFVAIRV